MHTDLERLQQILSFLETVDRLKSTYRAAYLAHEDRHESTAEHLWHACLYALLLHRESGADADLGRVLELLIVHDLVEVYAGDTVLHDEEARKGQKQREAEAADRLFPQLPEDVSSYVRAAWEEFEAGNSREARFAQEVDRIQAIAQNVFSKGRAWADHQVTEELARRRNERALGFEPSLREVFEALYQRASREGLWSKDAR